MDSARTLSENLAALLQREHAALAQFLVALADFDRRRVWAELGYSSLFYYLYRELRLSKGAAQYRKVAAELIQDIPAVVEPLREGRLCLTSIIEAAKVVTPENWETVLPRFYGLSKREAMEVVAVLEPHPAPPMRTVLSCARPAATAVASPAVPEPARAPAPAAAADAPTPAAGWPDEPALVPCSAAAAPASRPSQLVPLTAEHGRLHVTVSKRFARKLEEAKAARPGATDEELLEAGLDLLLAQVAKRRGPRREAPAEAPALEARPHRGPRPAGGVEAGRRAVPLAARFRWDLRLHAPPAARPYRSAGARRHLDRRQPQDPLREPQSGSGPAGLRRRVHGQVRGRRAQTSARRRLSRPTRCPGTDGP
jgi:hypothetical protein